MAAKRAVWASKVLCSIIVGHDGGMMSFTRTSLGATFVVVVALFKGMHQTNKEASSDGHRRIRLTLIDDRHESGGLDLINYRDPHEDDCKLGQEIDAS
jgi:hypothetical protein